VTTYQRDISLMDETTLSKVKPGFWARTYGVDPEVITECVENRWKELLRDRPEADNHG
jgi:hypothetical protein